MFGRHELGRAAQMSGPAAEAAVSYLLACLLAYQHAPQGAKTACQSESQHLQQVPVGLACSAGKALAK